MGSNFRSVNGATGKSWTWYVHVSILCRDLEEGGPHRPLQIIHNRKWTRTLLPESTKTKKQKNKKTKNKEISNVISKSNSSRPSQIMLSTRWIAAAHQHRSSSQRISGCCNICAAARKVNENELPALVRRILYWEGDQRTRIRTNEKQTYTLWKRIVAKPKSTPPQLN